MKKLLSIALILCIALSSFTTAYAQDNNSTTQEIDGTIIFEQEEITDKDELFERAQSNISDTDVPEKQKGYFFRDEAGNIDESIESDIYYTSQILRKVEDSKGEIKTYLAVTAIVNTEVPVEEDTQALSMTNSISKLKFNPSYSYITGAGLNKVSVKEDIPTMTTLSGKIEDKYDSSYSFRSYHTLYYDLNTNDVTLERVIGEWICYDSSVTGSNRSIQARQVSSSDPNSYKTKYPSSNSGKDFYTNFSSVGVGWTNLASINKITLTRGGTTWNFTTQFTIEIQAGSISDYWIS